MNPYVILFVSNVMPVFAWLVGLLIPGYGGRRAWQEAKNKAKVMAMVNNVETILTPEALNEPLGQLVEFCYRENEIPALFTIEGLGFLYTRRLAERHFPPANVLTAPDLEALPANSLTMLHAGMGLSFARDSLAGLKKDSPPEQFLSRLSQFIENCRRSSRPGYSGCALEILGIPAVILHGTQVAQQLGRYLAQIDPPAAEFLWRGVGRALYFYPQNFIPSVGNPWKGFDMAASLAPNELARKNMIAGLAWACTLVNIRHPQIMESLIRFQADKEADRDALVNGVMSAVLMNYDTTPEDVHLHSFITHQPAGNPSLSKLWTEIISQPCEQALKEIYPVLKQHRALEELFRYQSLFELRNRLAERGNKC